LKNLRISDSVIVIKGHRKGELGVIVGPKVPTPGWHRVRFPNMVHNDHTTIKEDRLERIKEDF